MECIWSYTDKTFYTPNENIKKNKKQKTKTKVHMS